MTKLSEAERKVTDLIGLLNTHMGMNLLARISTIPPDACDAPNPPGHPSESSISVELSGSGISLLLADEGTLLHAVEYVAARILRLQPGERDRLTIDAGSFNESRDRNLRIAAHAAVASVYASGEPHTFPPLASRERRILHLELASSGLQSASSGHGPKRSVVLYPLGAVLPPPVLPIHPLPSQLPSQRVGGNRPSRILPIDAAPTRRTNR